MPYHRQWHVPEAEIGGQLQHFGFCHIQRIKKATLLKLTLKEGIHFLLLPFNREAIMSQKFRYWHSKKSFSLTFSRSFIISSKQITWQKVSIYNSYSAYIRWMRDRQYIRLKRFYILRSTFKITFGTKSLISIYLLPMITMIRWIFTHYSSLQS